MWKILDSRLLCDGSQGPNFCVFVFVCKILILEIFSNKGADVAASLRF